MFGWGFLLAVFPMTPYFRIEQAGKHVQKGSKVRRKDRIPLTWPSVHNLADLRQVIERKQSIAMMGAMVVHVLQHV